MNADLLFEEALYVVFPPDQLPLITPRDLQGVRFSHLQETGNMLVRTNCGPKGTRHVFYDTGVVDGGFEVATLAGLVASGLGACLPPETSLPQFSLLPTRAVRISPKMMTRPICFVSPKGRTLSPANCLQNPLTHSLPTSGENTSPC
jgi:DNA-binding transcriptional LysR family regulator